MDLFLSSTSKGTLIGRGVPSEPPQVVFPGAGAHLPKVLRLLPPAVSGVVEVSLSLAVSAVIQCLKPPDPDTHMAAFLDCLVPVDKLNTGWCANVSLLARTICGGEPDRFLERAGLHCMRLDKTNWAYKLIRNGKSTWVAVDQRKAHRLETLLRADESRETSRSPRRGSSEPSG
jgi:hypothetical protein